MPLPLPFPLCIVCKPIIVEIFIVKIWTKSKHRHTNENSIKFQITISSSLKPLVVFKSKWCISRYDSDGFQTFIMEFRCYVTLSRSNFVSCKIDNSQVSHAGQFMNIDFPHVWKNQFKSLETFTKSRASEKKPSASKLRKHFPSALLVLSGLCLCFFNASRFQQMTQRCFFVAFIASRTSRS